MIKTFGWGIEINHLHTEKILTQNLCDSCETTVDQNTHVLYCPAYRDLRAGKSLESDYDLATYIKEVLVIQAKLRLNR